MWPNRLHAIKRILKCIFTMPLHLPKISHKIECLRWIILNDIKLTFYMANTSG